jgi:thiol-disulfide isomerase/thioredoxin
VSIASLGVFINSCAAAQNDRSAAARDDHAAAPAESAWNELLKTSEPLDIPEGWARKPPTAKEIQRFHRRSGAVAAKAADQARKFYTRFSGHPKAFRARVMQCELLAAAVHLGVTDRAGELRSAQEALGKEPALTDDDRFSIRSAGIQRIAYYLQFAGYTVNLDEFEKGIRELQKEFPKRPEPYELLLLLAKNRFFEDEIARARAVAEELAASAAPVTIVDDAKAMVKRFGRIGQPLRFKFTALDGREVDLEKLRGKVLLIDCWATWCPPCIREIPRLKTLYARLREKGFEIVGISWDDDKEALQKFVTEKQIVWPQYFDGKGELNRFAVEHDITGVPTTWLLDKQGVLRDVNALKNLESKVEKLLRE